jgi:hypothetical protein
MNPLVFIVPFLLVIAGLAAFFLVPLPLTIRLLILVSDIVTAVVVVVVLLRRGR